MQPVEFDPSCIATSSTPARSRRGDTVCLVAIAALVAVIHIATNSRYGFHRDELQFLSDARHLEWGFVAYPPFTAFVQRVGMALFGLNLVGLRVFSVLAQSVVIAVAGLIAREFGGGRPAQLAAAAATAFAPLALFEGAQFQYTSFDLLWWVLSCYFVVRLLNTENPRWWIAIGASLGFGLETKYAIVFLIAGLVAGLALTERRHYFARGWFWGGVALALALFLPNLIWLCRHQFISLTFLEHIHVRDVGEGRAQGFWRDQFLISANLAAAPLWIAGLVGLIVNRRYRVLAWMAAVPVLLFAIAKGRGYYTAGVYPMMVSMGAVLFERWLTWLPRMPRRTIAIVYSAAFAAVSVYACAVILPIASSGPLRQFAMRHNGDLREEIGWDELVRTVAGIRDSLPAEERAHLGITTANYGEYGAVEILGSAYGLPQPIGTTNSEWYRGYPATPPTTFIVLGLGRAEADSIFTGCRLAGHNGNSEGVKNEESQDHPDIFVCGPPKIPVEQLWREHRDFG